MNEEPDRSAHGIPGTAAGPASGVGRSRSGEIFPSPGTGRRTGRFRRLASPSIFFLSSLILPLVLFSGCGIFDTRDPENPINAGSAFEPPTSPSIVLRNMQSALNFANALDYRKCFSDSSVGLQPFRFQASVEGLAVAPGRFATWTVNDEEAYIRNIFAELAEDATASVSFNPSDIADVPIGDSIRFTADYAVSFPHTRQGVEREASGRLLFTLKLSPRNEWYITYWQDIAVDGKPTWSLLKARFSD